MPRHVIKPNPDKARQLIVQAKCDGVTDRDYFDALHTIAGLQYSYRVTHPTPTHRRMGESVIDAIISFAINLVGIITVCVLVKTMSSK